MGLCHRNAKWAERKVTHLQGSIDAFVIIYILEVAAKSGIKKKDEESLQFADWIFDQIFVSHVVAYIWWLYWVR